MNIPQVAPSLGEEEKRLVMEALDANWITEGPKCREFSERLNDLMGTKYGVFAPNGTLALYLGLCALGIGAGDEVIVPDTTFIGSANAVVMTGATPVFVDVNPRNFQIDASVCAPALSPRTRAVMPVHLYGMTVDMDNITEFASKNGLAVIEDAAQAVGVHYRGRHAGTFGDVGCFSFFADKTITTGEGGYVVCRTEETYERLLLLRNQGRLNRGSFIHPAIGYNFRITDLQGAVGLAQIGRLDDIIRRKREILEIYSSLLEGISEVRFLELQEGSTYAPFRIVLICQDAHHLMEFLESAGIQTRTFFYPLHRQPCFQERPELFPKPGSLDDSHFPNAISGYEHGMCLPVHPTLTEEEVVYICTKIKEFYGHE